MPLTYSLTAKYRPHKIQDFIGLEKVKRVLTAFVANPYETAFLFTGPPGMGKTSMAEALVCEFFPEDMNPPMWRFHSAQCNVDEVRRMCNQFGNADIFLSLKIRDPQRRWRFVIVDEIDEVTRPASIEFLSLLEPPPSKTIFIFTRNGPDKDDDGDLEEDKLEPRFRQRCIELKFSSYGIQPALASFLAKVWAAEAPKEATQPNFGQLARNANGSVRAALKDLELRLLTLAT